MFIQLDDGRAIAINQVASCMVRNDPKDRQQVIYYLYDKDNQTLGTIHKTSDGFLPPAEWLNSLSAQVIPAQPGYYGVNIDDSNEATIYVHPVIAWKATQDQSQYLDDVYLDPILSGVTRVEYIVTPIGTVYETGIDSTWYANWNDFLASLGRDTVKVFAPAGWHPWAK